MIMFQNFATKQSKDLSKIVDDVIDLQTEFYEEDVTEDVKEFREELERVKEELKSVGKTCQLNNRQIVSFSYFTIHLISSIYQR